MQNFINRMLNSQNIKKNRSKQHLCCFFQFLPLLTLTLPQNRWSIHNFQPSLTAGQSFETTTFLWFKQFNHFTNKIRLNAPVPDSSNICHANYVKNKILWHAFMAHNTFEKMQHYIMFCKPQFFDNSSLNLVFLLNTCCQ